MRNNVVNMAAADSTTGGSFNDQQVNVPKYILYLFRAAHKQTRRIYYYYYNIKAK